MSFYYRGEEPYGPYRFEDLPDLGPYQDESYSKRPVRSDKFAGSSHHPDCEYKGDSISDCMCFELYNRDYDMKQEREETKRWQYYNGVADA
jgi:hypothetical protein